MPEKRRYICGPIFVICLVQITKSADKDNFKKKETIFPHSILLQKNKKKYTGCFKRLWARWNNLSCNLNLFKHSTFKFEVMVLGRTGNSMSRFFITACVHIKSVKSFLTYPEFVLFCSYTAEKPPSEIFFSIVSGSKERGSIS